jgi:hypothetical protein
LLKRRTLGELRWPNTPEFSTIAKAWRQDASDILIGFIWQGYDLLTKEMFSKIDVSQAEDEIERSITQYLTPSIRKAMTGFEPFEVEQGVHEFETRMPPPAQPPLYDIAFVLRENKRIMWPMEAKILKTDGAIAEYVKEIENNFLTCRYAPFSNEGAMLGYLLSGNPGKAFDNISRKAGYKLTNHPGFPIRYHKISEHKRRAAPERNCPIDFYCHHMIMKVEG